MDKKILFVTYGGGHVNTLVPVIKKLRQNKNFELVVLGLTTAGEVLKNNGIPFIGFKDLLSPSNQQALAWGRKLVGPPGATSVVPYEESIAYMGLSYTDLEFRYGVEEAAHIYLSQGGRQTFYPLSIMERFLRDENPDLVVATNSPRAERAAISAAGNLGIPAICLVDLFAFQEVRWIGKHGYASKVCVLSDYVRQKIIEAGRRSEDVIVTGNPAFDSMVEKQNSVVRKNFRLKKDWPVSERVVLWASNVEPKVHPYSNIEGDADLPRKVEKQLLRLVEDNDDIRVVFRPHPNDSHVPVFLPDKVEISTSHDDIGELLGAVDCVVVLTSTVGLQAALMGKPLVNIKLSIFSADAPYEEMGISVGVDDLEKLNSAILEALEEGQAGIGLPEIGVATDKVVNVIEGLLRESA